MTRFEFSVTIGAAALNLATQAFLGTVGQAYPAGHSQVYGTSYLPATRLEAYLDVGSTGTAYLGPSTLTSAGANKAYTLAPGSGANYGGNVFVQNYGMGNTIDLAAYWVHGSNAGDKVVIVFQQD